MFCRLSALLLLGGILNAQVHIPQVGSIRCVDGSLRQVYGLPSSFILSKPLAKSVNAASFSDGAGLISSEGRIQLLDAAGSVIGEFASNDPSALVNVDGDVSTAAAWLPATNSILIWDAGQFHQIALTNPPQGRVTSIRREGDRAFLLVLDQSAVSELAVSLRSGDEVSESFLAGIDSPALQMNRFIVFPGPTGLQIESSDGSRRTLGLIAPDLVIERMASDWLHLSSASSDQHWALHITGKQLEISQLPGIRSEEYTK